MWDGVNQFYPSILGIVQRVTERGQTGGMTMHGFLAGALFVAMVLAPCAIAMATGVDRKEEAQDNGIGSHVPSNLSVPGS
jgi:hypothetical protein